MAKVPNAAEILPKVWTAWLGRTSVTDNRQTTDRQMGDSSTYSERNVSSRLLRNLNSINELEWRLWLWFSCSKYRTDL